jgi:hypothetical protein
MIRAISELLDFDNNREASPDLNRVLEVLEGKRIRVISSNIFDWLKRQQRFGHEKPLDLSLEKQSTWYKELPVMLDLWPAMNELFLLEEKKLDFRDTVTADERAQIRQLVFERDRPVLMVKKVKPSRA